MNPPFIHNFVEFSFEILKFITHKHTSINILKLHLFAYIFSESLQNVGS